MPHLLKNNMFYLALLIFLYMTILAVDNAQKMD